MKTLNIRGHHFSCIPRFYHGGYDKSFADNMKKLVWGIRKNPDIKVRAIIGCDDLCYECPYNSQNECTQSEEIGKWVIDQDKKILKHLKLENGRTYKARDVFNLSMDKVNTKNINQVCKGCIYLENCLKVGINNSFRKDLNRS